MMDTKVGLDANYTFTILELTRFCSHTWGDQDDVVSDVFIRNNETILLTGGE